MKKLIAVLIVLGLGFVGYTYASTPASGDVQGGVNFELVDSNGAVVINQYYEFTEEISLYDLLQEHYTIGCADSSYSVDYTCGYTQLNGHIVLAVENVETDWFNSFLEITVNGVYSYYGADEIMLEDNTTYTLTYTSLGGGE